MPGEKTGEFGRYSGPLILEALGDGRRMRVASRFEFEDPDNKRWTVPEDATVDGASIPGVLWPLAGGPWEGKYRNASVIHDYYCDTRTEPWPDVHRVFYYGMRTSGVSELRAKLFYAAVRGFGPRWSDATVYNSRLSGGESRALPASDFFAGVAEAVTIRDETFAMESSGESGDRWTSGSVDLDLDKLQELIDSSNPTLDEIDAAMDATL